jgi:HlyD family secretion protein
MNVVQLWKTESQMLASIATVRKAVNTLIMVEQADTKVKLAREALRQAKVALDQAQQRLTETKVYAPSDGIIQEVFVKKGQIISSGITTVTGGTPLLILADVSKLYVESDVDEADIGRVRELAAVERSARLEFFSTLHPTTQPKLTKENEEEMAMLRKSNNVDVTVDAFRELTFTGRVDRVYPNPKNINNIVTYNVRILLTSPNRTELMLGMHANVKFTSRKLVGVLKVDNEAIKVKHEERGVYIEGPPPARTPMFVPVKVGLTNGSQIELKTDKLKPGDKVYVKLPPSKEDEKKASEE